MLKENLANSYGSFLIPQQPDCRSQGMPSSAAAANACDACRLEICSRSLRTSHGDEPLRVQLAQPCLHLRRRDAALAFVDDLCRQLGRGRRPGAALKHLEGEGVLKLNPRPLYEDLDASHLRGRRRKREGMRMLGLGQGTLRGCISAKQRNRPHPSRGGY